MQGVELGVALLGVGGQQVVDLGLHHLGHPAHRLVLGHRQVTVVAEVAVEPLQGQRQQRQRIRPFGGLGQQPLHQRRFDNQPPTGGAGPPGRTGDDLGVSGGGHRFEFVEHHAVHPGQLRGDLQRLVAVGADGDRQDHPRRHARFVFDQRGKQLQEARGLGSGVGVEQFLGLIHRQHQGGGGLLSRQIEQPGPRSLAGLLQPASQPLHLGGQAGGS